MKILAWVTEQEKEKKDIKIGKQEVEPSLFADDRILYT